MKIIIVCCLLLTGCGTLFAPNIDDLKLINVNIVNLLEKPKNLEYPMNRSSQELLEINFISHKNLLSIARDHEFNLSNKIFFCTDGPDKYTFGLGRGLSSVYYYNNDNSQSSDIVLYDENFTISPVNGVFNYSVYIASNNNARVNAVGEKVPAYDLHSLPDNLCVRVQGGNMLGTYFVSNIFTIPTELILDAIRKYNNMNTSQLK